MDFRQYSKYLNALSIIDTVLWNKRKFVIDLDHDDTHPPVVPFKEAGLEPQIQSPLITLLLKLIKKKENLHKDIEIESIEKRSVVRDRHPYLLFPVSTDKDRKSL